MLPLTKSRIILVPEGFHGVRVRTLGPLAVVRRRARVSGEKRLHAWVVQTTLPLHLTAAQGHLFGDIWGKQAADGLTWGQRRPSLCHTEVGEQEGVGLLGRHL